MKDLTVDTVWQAVEELLDRNSIRLVEKKDAPGTSA
jgi:hypothetical protein